MGATKDDPPIVSIPYGFMSAKRMHDLVTSYGIPPGYVYKIPLDREYVSIIWPLKVSICEFGLVFVFLCILLLKDSLVDIG